MTTLLSQTGIQLWIWIIIIVAGSMIIITIPIIIYVCCAKRKQPKKDVEEPNLAPMRKVTVRRGRMVSNSRYLSLTGSKFGLNQFMNGSEKEDQSDRGTNRSRSPFMWWAANMQERSHSRQSYASSQQQMSEVAGPSLQRPTPAFRRQHSQQDSGSSDYSLPSIINGRELAENAILSESPGPDVPTSRYVNFSRSLSPRHQSFSTPKVLSQIMENSPRQSKYGSKHHSLVSVKEIGASPPSPDVQAPGHAYTQSPRSTPRASRRTSGPLELSRFSFNTETSMATDLSRARRTPEVAPISLPKTPRPGRANTYQTTAFTPTYDRRPKLNESHTDPTSSSEPRYPPELQHLRQQSPAALTTLQPGRMHPTPSQASLDRVSRDWSASSASPTTPTSPQMIREGYARNLRDRAVREQAAEYWDQRGEPRPIRRPSKKGKVLRKKSLTRAEMRSSLN